MSVLPGAPLVYDAGALMAAERNSRQFRSLHVRALNSNKYIVVPTPVLTQVWRGGARQALLSRALNGCVIEPTDEVTAKTAGVLLGHCGTSDAVDAIVVATALRLEAVVVSSDPADLYKLADAAERPNQLTVITI